MGGMPGIAKNTYFGPQTFKIVQIIRFRFSILFKFNFDTKSLFLLFLVHSWEMKERSSDSSNKEKNIIDINLDHQNNRYLCQIVLFDKNT
jgi:hypothetical protein